MGAFESGNLEEKGVLIFLRLVLPFIDINDHDAKALHPGAQELVLHAIIA